MTRIYTDKSKDMLGKLGRAGLLIAAQIPSVPTREIRGEMVLSSGFHRCFLV